MFLNALRSLSASYRRSSPKQACILAWGLLLLGCSQQPTTAYISPPAPQNTLPTATLTHLLVGEFSAQRGDSKQAAMQLLAAATTTRDLSTAKRAALAAQFSHDQGLVEQTSHLWSQLAPTDPTPWQHLAQSQAQTGNFDSALLSLQQVLNRGGGEGLSQVANIGISGAEQGFAAIYKQYLRWIEQYPNQHQLLYSLALLEHAKGRPKAAITLIKKALAQDPNYLQAQVFYGELLLATQAISEADQYLSQLTEILNQAPHQLVVLHAQALTLTADYERAYQYFNELTSRFPQNPNFHHSAGILAFEINAHTQAKRHLQQALILKPDSHNSHYYLGLSAIKEGHEKAAIHHFKQVTLGPNRLAAIAELVNLQSPEPGHIEPYFSALRQTHHDLAADVYNLQAEYLLQLGEPQMAARVYAAGSHFFPQHISLLYGHALVAQNLNDPRLTEQLLERILSIEPAHINALNALGYIYAEQGIKLELAETLIRKALALAPDNAAIIDSLGWVTYRQGHLRQAKTLLSKAFAILPDAEIAAHLGLVEWALGDTEGAFTTWNEALAKEPDNQFIKQAIMDAQNDFGNN